MVQAVQNPPNPFIATAPPPAPRAGPLAGDSRAFIPEPSAIVSLGTDTERPFGLVYNADGSLDIAAARLAPELSLLQASGLNDTADSSTNAPFALSPNPTPATLALALDDGLNPQNFNPVSALLGTSPDSTIFVPDVLLTSPQPATATTAVTPTLFAALQEAQTLPNTVSVASGPLFAQSEPSAAAAAAPLPPEPPAAPTVSAPTTPAVPPAPTAAPDTDQQLTLQRTQQRELEPELRVADPAASTLTAEAALLERLSTAPAPGDDSAPASPSPDTAPVTIPLTEADHVFAADLQALAQPEAETSVVTASQPAQTPTGNPALSNPMSAAAVTPQQAANNPFAPAMAASLYLSAMNFRAQQSSSAGLDNPAEAVQPVGGVRAVSPTFFNRDSPADDSRRPGV